MNMSKRTLIVSVIALLASVAISFGFRTYSEVRVPSGFVFGPPVAQQEMHVPGIYRVTRYGFPATYQEINSFRSTSGSFYETSYDSKPFKWFLVVINAIFWMGLSTLLLLPIARLNKSRGGTYYFASSKKEAKKTVTAHDNPRS